MAMAMAYAVWYMTFGIVRNDIALFFFVFSSYVAKHQVDVSFYFLQRGLVCLVRNTKHTIFFFMLYHCQVGAL